jgi:uncharacterized protein (TIGR03382 family)
LSFINSVNEALTADDFPCTETGWITDIEFDGFALQDPANLDRLRITFWSDVPATSEEESHPGTLLKDLSVGPADPMGLGWKQIDVNRYKVNLPRDSWFVQTEGTIYWIGIQGVMTNNDVFGWLFRDPTADTWGDDAAFTGTDYAPWWHWGWDEEYVPQLYQGTLPSTLVKSADMSFKLTGIPIPEPGVFALAGLGVLALLRRRKTTRDR